MTDGGGAKYARVGEEGLSGRWVVAEHVNCGRPAAELDVEPPAKSVWSVGGRPKAAEEPGAAEDAIVTCERGRRRQRGRGRAQASTQGRGWI